MRALVPFVLLAGLAAVAAALPAQTPVVTWAGETMRLRSATVTPSGGNAFAITLTMENDNANASLPTSFRRWWHCEIANLPAAGAVLTITVANAGYTDVILPVWATSTDGVAFGPYARCPTSAVPTQPTGTSHRFALAPPPGTAAIRLAKYFPYSTARKDAFVQSLAGHPRVRAIAVLGNSLQDRPLQLVTLTDGAVPDAGKVRVWIHAGIHPAETTSYFTVEGLLGWLLSGDPFAELLLDRAIVDVVPMANPDGVALGNYRTNGASSNLEEQWGAPYASPEVEVAALRAAIEARMGTPQAPATNPIRVLLNLHSSHNVAFPFHFRHVANASWAPGGSGVIPAVNALESQWIAAFAAHAPFVAAGATQSSTLSPPSRPYVESMLHDRWSAVPQWAANGQQPAMAITFEGTYGLAANGSSWNTEADYRACGAQLGRALADHFGFRLGASATEYGSPCASAVLTGAIAPQGAGHQATLSLAGAPANALGFVVLGFQRAQAPLPPPFQACSLLCSLDANASWTVGPLGTAQLALFVPPWPGLVANLQAVTLDLAQPSPLLDASNGLELRNTF